MLLKKHLGFGLCSFAFLIALTPWSVAKAEAVKGEPTAAEVAEVSDGGDEFDPNAMLTGDWGGGAQESL